MLSCIHTLSRSLLCTHIHSLSLTYLYTRGLCKLLTFLSLSHSLALSLSHSHFLIHTPLPSLCYSLLPEFIPEADIKYMISLLSLTLRDLPNLYICIHPDVKPFSIESLGIRGWRTLHVYQNSLFSTQTMTMSAGNSQNIYKR